MKFAKIHTFIRSTAAVVMIVVMAGVMTHPVLAIDKNKTMERLNDCMEVFQEIMDIPEGGIPDWLLEKSEALVIIPGVIKAAFGFGGRRGHGIMIHRLDNGKWSSPSFVTITGGSFGLQIGGSSTDLVLVVNNKRGYHALLSDKVKLGADASVAAGPVGRSAEAGTDVQFKAEIYAYARSKGVFAGISLDGSALTNDSEANTAFYGKMVDYKQVLNNPTWPFPEEAKPLLDLLHKYEGRK
jgi:lipid-binding SYLF domain-containing protein